MLVIANIAKTIAQDKKTQAFLQFLTFGIC